MMMSRADNMDETSGAGLDMCILFIKLLKAAKSGDFKLILAANRDEFFKRPAKRAHFWSEDETILGGRDMTENKEGGTWLAMSKKGKLGILLNVTGGEVNPDKLGRGFLVADFLKSSLTDKEYLEKVKQNGHRYNEFHLVTAVLGSQPSLLHYSNEAGCSNVTQIESETFALGNSSLESPFRKVTRGKEKFEEICSQFGKTETKERLVEELLSLLKWEEKHYPDEIIDSLSHLPTDFKPYYSAVCVNMPELAYGTRTHTIILVDSKDNVEFHEWTLKEPIDPNHKEWVANHETFRIESKNPSRL